MIELLRNPFDDGRGRFPDKITLNAPRGLRELARHAAEREGLTVAEFLRREIYKAVSAKPGADVREGNCEIGAND